MDYAFLLKFSRDFRFNISFFKNVKNICFQEHSEL